jgi:UDP-3-O-[3-hydroxymyristoyl] N-acetylglucosamine deacetylase/3-hydroxyacyl-[acyl-carrier-protein] dehydratase
MDEEQTIGKAARLSGVGLHTGAEIRVELLPAEPGSGVYFVRTDLAGQPRVEARPENLVSRPRRSALARGDASVETTEHLLAALSGAGVQNLEVRIDGPELPGLDGSALPYYEAIREAGVTPQGRRAREIRVSHPIALTERGASIIAFSRSAGFRVGYTLDYSGMRRQTQPGCPTTQFLELDLGEETFAREIAPARTFVLEEEIAALRAEGLGKGATVENTLVLGKDGILLGNRLRFDDEFVRHKILDLLGDLYLLGSRLQGHVLATKSGHGLNVELARRIQESARRAEVASGGSAIPGERGASGATGTPATQDSVLAPLDIRQIQRILPHRYPFLMVDRVLEIEADRRVVGLKNVTVNEGFFQGHFPGRPVMPGVLIVEAMAQLAGMLLLKKCENGGRLAFLLSLEHVKFRRTVEPGDQLILQAEVKRLKSRIAEVEARAMVDGATAAEAEIRFMIVES